MLPVVVVTAIIASLIVVIAGAISGDGIGLGSGASSSGMYSASSSSWEQFLRYVATKEGGTKTKDGLYYIVEDDGASNPTVGHGLCLKSGDGYLHVDEFAEYGVDSQLLAEQWISGDRDGKVSVEICDAIWGTHVKAKYDLIVSKYPDLTTYQHYALTDVEYRRGNTRNFQEKYNGKWSSSDDQFGNYVEANEPFDTNTLFDFFWDRGHRLDGVNIRKKDQWVLFKYGYYRPLNEYFVKAGNFKNLDVYNNDGSINDEKISELQLALENSFNLVAGNPSGNNIGGRYNMENCTKVTGTYLGYSGNTSTTTYKDATTSYLGNNGLAIYQCTWWANGRASEYLSQYGTKYKQYPSNSGNGGEIYSLNVSSGWFNYGKTPKANSLVSYTNSSSGYGHVAYVEAVDEKNGYYYISHAGSGLSWYGIQKVAIDSGPWGWNVEGFVYLDEPK